MYKKIDDINFSVFDTETTGLDPESGDRIIEIAAVRLSDGAQFSSLVNPGRPVSQAAFAVNHISAEMLRDAPRIEAVMPRFLEFVKGTVLCSYNARFDMAFINNELKLIEMHSAEELVAVDALAMSRRLLPGLERHALWYVAESLGIKQEQEHRALSDVNLTIGVFNRFKDMLYAKGIMDFENLFSLFGVAAPFIDDIENKKIIRIQEAIDLGVKLKIRYLARSDAEVTEREVEPMEIKQENGRAYLIGYCNLRQDKRTFRVDGILQLEVI